MNHRKTFLCAATLALLSGSVVAQSQPIIGYWLDTSGRIVRNTWGECWRTGSWTPALAIPECEGGMRPAPTPVAAPAAPAPMPAPAPAPTPAPIIVAPVAPAVVTPPPASEPQPVFRTAITERAVRLEGANFATGSSRLLSGAAVKLGEVVNAARQYPDMNMTVTGYTDSTGNAQSNVRLSQARADAVKAYLVGEGVAAGRISTSGKGAAEPVADNGTAEGRAQNRRVEIRYAFKEETRVRVQP